MAVDPSRGSHNALNWAADNLCDSQKDMLHVVHSFRPLEPMVGEGTDYVPTRAYAYIYICVCV